MKRIGVLFGMENTFPGALVERINGMELPDVAAEFVQLGAVGWPSQSRTPSSSIASRTTCRSIAPT